MLRKVIKVDGIHLILDAFFFNCRYPEIAVRGKIKITKQHKERSGGDVTWQGQEIRIETKPFSCGRKVTEAAY